MSDLRRSSGLRAARVALAVAAALTGVGIARSAGEAEALLREADRARGSFGRGLVRLSVSDIAGDGRSFEGEIDVYVGADDAMLAVFRSGKQRGRKVLSTSEGTWLILPDARHPVPVTGQQRLAGAASIADLARLRLAESYRPVLREAAERIRGVDCRILDLHAAPPGGPYPTAVLWVGAADRAPYRLLLRLASGREAKLLDFVGWRAEGGRVVLDRLEIRDLLRRRETVTEVRFLAYEPRGLEPTLFTVEGARALP